MIYQFIFNLAIALLCFLHYFFFFFPIYCLTLLTHLTDIKNSAGYKILPHSLMLRGHWQTMLDCYVRDERPITQIFIFICAGSPVPLVALGRPLLLAPMIHALSVGCIAGEGP